MKRLKTFLVLLICLALMAGSLVACDSSSSKKKSKKSSKIEKEDDDEDDDDDDDDSDKKKKKKHDDDDDDDKDSDKKHNKDDDDEDDVKPTKPSKVDDDDDDDDRIFEAATDLSIDEVVLYDADDIKVTATQIVHDDYYGNQIEILIENNTDMDVTFRSNQVLVNGCVDEFAYLFEEVKADTKTYTKLSLNDSRLERLYGIKNIGEIKFIMVGRDDDYNSVFETDEIVITTNKYAKMDSPKPFDGTEIFDQNGVYGVIRYSAHDDWSVRFDVYVQNDSDNDIYISLDSLEIDGFSIDGSLYLVIPANTCGASELSIYTDDLETNRIDDFDSMLVTFLVRDSKSYQEIFTTDEIEVKVK